jgi:Uma2 family endonuclease
MINPNVIVEGLSPSMEAYDRGRKFQRYKGIGSLEQYVLISSERARWKCSRSRKAGSGF